MDKKKNKNSIAKFTSPLIFVIGNTLRRKEKKYNIKHTHKKKKETPKPASKKSACNFEENGIQYVYMYICMYVLCAQTTGLGNRDWFLRR